jgi:hypothetical protein
MAIDEGAGKAGKAKSFSERIAEDPVLWLLRAVAATAILVCGAIAGGKELFGVDVVPEGQYVLEKNIKKDHVGSQVGDYIHSSDLDREYISKAEVEAKYILRSECNPGRAIVPTAHAAANFACLSPPSRWTGQLKANGGSYAIELEVARKGQSMTARYLSTSSEWHGPFLVGLDSDTRKIIFKDELASQNTWTLYCNENGALRGYIEQGSKQTAQVLFTRSP